MCLSCCCGCGCTSSFSMGLICSPPSLRCMALCMVHLSASVNMYHDTVRLCKNGFTCSSWTSFSYVTDTHMFISYFAIACDVHLTCIVCLPLLLALTTTTDTPPKKLLQVPQIRVRGWFYNDATSQMYYTQFFSHTPCAIISFLTGSQ